MAHYMGRNRQLFAGQLPPGLDPASTLAAEIAAEALLRGAARQAIIAAAANAVAELCATGSSGGLQAITTNNISPGGPIDGPEPPPESYPSGP